MLPLIQDQQGSYAIMAGAPERHTALVPWAGALLFSHPSVRAGGYRSASPWSFGAGRRRAVYSIVDDGADTHAYPTFPRRPDRTHQAQPVRALPGWAPAGAG